MNSSRTPTASTRLPILFCLDVSASMAVHSHQEMPPIMLLNEAVKQLLNQLRNEFPMTEVAFLTFSEKDVDYIPFQPISYLLDLEFRVVADQNATSLAWAVEKSVYLIEQRKKELERLRVANYPPFLIVVTDGDEGDKTQADIKRAQNLILSHCQSHSGERSLIVPFMICVGEGVSLNRLREYSRGFPEGTFRLKNHAQIQIFRAVFKILGDSIGSSIDLKTDYRNLLKILGQGVKEKKKNLPQNLQDMWDDVVGGIQRDDFMDEDSDGSTEEHQ